AVAALTGSGSVTYSRNGNVITGTGSGGITQTVNFLRKENNTSTSYVKDGVTVTADSIHLTQYNETDWLDAGQTQPAFDTYGIDHQIIEKHLTVRVYDVGRIDDSFTLAYAFEKDGIADETDDPVLIRYADPLIYMVQYDPSKTNAPTVESVGNDFKGTIFIGTMGDDATLTQVYPTGTSKTMKPSAKEVKIQVHGAEELFRVYGDPDATIGCTYSSTLNTSTGEQDFTYSITGTDLEEPIVHSDTSGCAVTTTSTTAATLTWTLEAPEESGTRNALQGTKGLRSSGVKGLAVTEGIATKGSKIGTVTGKDAIAALGKEEKGDVSDAAEQKEVIRKEEEVIVVQSGSRVERNDEEHVTRYYEYFPDAEGSEDGWILVLQVFDEGYMIPIVVAEPTEVEIEEEGEDIEGGEVESEEVAGEEGAEGAEGSEEADTEEGAENGEGVEVGEGAEGSEEIVAGEDGEDSEGVEVGESTEGSEENIAGDNAEGSEENAAGEDAEGGEENVVGESTEGSEENAAGEGAEGGEENEAGDDAEDKDDAEAEAKPETEGEPGAETEPTVEAEPKKKAEPEVKAESEAETESETEETPETDEVQEGAKS
ncbi:MAG: hypothetical protein J6U66_09285, partial [Lachnospiraceae bacterium]|nr:hypothetical protein [Lachnospiraceae bacterium]